MAATKKSARKKPEAEQRPDKRAMRERSRFMGSDELADVAKLVEDLADRVRTFSENVKAAGVVDSLRIDGATLIYASVAAGVDWLHKGNAAHERAQIIKKAGVQDPGDGTNPLRLPTKYHRTK